MKKRIKKLPSPKKISNIDSQCAPKKTKPTKMALHTTYEVKWKNFKGFKDTGWIKIKPITIIIGPNNSGKTSFSAPLLLMNQTITSLEGTSPLILSGKIHEAGNIKEIINEYDLSKDFSFGFKYHVHEIEKNTKAVGKYPPGGLEVTFNVNNPDDRKLIVKKETIYDIYSRPYIELLKSKLGYTVKGVNLGTLNQDEKEAIKKIEPLNFLFSPNALLSALSEAEKNPDLKTRTKKLSKGFSELLQTISLNFSMARSVLGGISYIGPIRDNPHRYYEIKNINYHTVGTRGENVPDLILKNPQIKDQLNEWVKKFNFGDSVEFQKLSLSNSIGSIIFKKKGERHYTNIANAGFGASQILPLIIQGLVSPRNSLTIAEQPEIHLNPKLQGVLAELFVLMAKKDQRVIVETHSEHLLLRLRRLIAEKKITPEEIAVYFVEKVEGESKIREIKIDDDGAIASDEWPTGFFADTLAESLALATQQAKNRLN
jgi:predicted ATPase